MKYTDNPQPADNENIRSKKPWIKPEVVVLDITSGAIPGPEGVITGGGGHVGVDS